MKFIDFRDKCLIARATGEKDEWDNDVRDVVYEGACLFEEGGTGYSRSIITRAPSVYLPGVDVQVLINDYIEIETEFGRKILAIAKSVRDINMPWRTNVQITKIELKQAQGD